MRYRLTFRIHRVFTAVFFWFFVAAEIPYYFGSTGHQIGWIMSTSLLIAVGSWLAIRGSRMATLLADDEKVTVRGLLRTRSWVWHQIDTFVVETRLIGLYRRRVLGMRLSDGTTRWFTELNSSPSRKLASRVDEAAAVLNAHLSVLFSPPACSHSL